MIAVVNRGLDRYDHFGKGRDFELSDHLRPEQRHAVDAVLDSRDLAINVRGLPVPARLLRCVKLTVASERPGTRFSR